MVERLTEEKENSEEWKVKIERLIERIMKFEEFAKDFTERITNIEEELESKWKIKIESQKK